MALSLKKNPQPHRANWSGRGGAGNYNWEQAAEEERRQQEEENKAELDKKIKEAVEGALKMPEKAHRHVSKEEVEEEEEQG